MQLLGLIAAAVTIFVLMTPYLPKHSMSQSVAQLETIRIELSLAEQRWQSHHITDHKISASATVHPLICADFTAEFLVFS